MTYATHRHMDIASAYVDIWDTASLKHTGHNICSCIHIGTQDTTSLMQTHRTQHQLMHTHGTEHHSCRNTGHSICSCTHREYRITHTDTLNTVSAHADTHKTAYTDADTQTHETASLMHMGTQIAYDHIHALAHEHKQATSLCCEHT